MTGSRTIDEVRVVSLDDRTMGAEVLGAKAANLARARAAGLPVVDGFVIPPTSALRLVGPSAVDVDDVDEQVRAAWEALSHHGRDAVVVRSSSLAEDTQRSSHAGVFDSVVDVRGWEEFLQAVRTVLASSARAAPLAGEAPLALLIQRHVDPAHGGVMFTADPVTGRTDRLVVAVVDGGPQRLVSGLETGTLLVLDRRARVLEGPVRGRALRWRERAALVRLARRAEALFGGPQDIEWAVDVAGHPILLQSRPITASLTQPTGPVFGPGPIAETFPDPLRPLEEDLWVVPLREALRVALDLTSGAPRRALEESPIVVSVGGRPAVDLDLLEGGRARRRGVALLDPRGPVRRLRIAWQIGRLRAGLPWLVEDLVARLDLELRAVPALDALDDDDLVLLLDRSRSCLRAAHGYELLAGTLTADAAATGADSALETLARARRSRRSDAEIVAAHPVVLALTPPAIGRPPVLPEALAASGSPRASDAFDSGSPTALGPREGLRLRIRWLHELSARAASMLGERLAAAGQLSDAAAVVDLDLATIREATRSGRAVQRLESVLAASPLPARFRLTAEGAVVAVHDRPGDGVPAGGGRGEGLVEQTAVPSPGSVLVVETLDPRLAPVLADLAGLVAETGSPLSHLAILAREHGVPTVVAVHDAVRRFQPGIKVVVDGTTGEVQALSAAPRSEGESS